MDEKIKAQIEALQALITKDITTKGYHSSSNRPGAHRFREANRSAIKRGVHNSPEMKKMRESFKRRFGFEMTDEKNFPVMSPDFSWKKAREKIEARFQEADSASVFTQFLRAGIQTITNAMYEATVTTYEDFVTVVQSKLDTELYAPNHGVAFPEEVPIGGKYPEVGVAALDIKLVNRKFGSMYVVEKNLVEDDQTGSFQRQASLLAEYLKLLNEVWIYGKLQSVAAMKYINLTVPQSETKPSYEANYPWTSSAAPFRGGGYNQPTAFGALTQTNIQNGLIALMNQLNLQGIKMQVSPTRLLITPHYVFDASVLLHSAYYPSGAAAAGAVGGAFAENPIKGLLDLTVSRYIPDQNGNFIGDTKPWMIVDDTKPFFISQLREAVKLEQENPNSGRSFEEDLMRWKASTRMNGDWIDPRFAWRGSDGSV